MEEKLLSVKTLFEKEISNIKNINDVELVKINFLGKKGHIRVLIDYLKNIEDSNKKKLFGSEINKLKNEIELNLENLLKKVTTVETISDLTLPGNKIEVGSFHLVTKTIEDIETIFSRLGFYRRKYPEIETDYYAFEALNMPEDHPARDEWETFFIDTPSNNLVLTPHTSSGQIREMETKKPPIRMLNIAKCYRRQEDATHVQMLVQFEGLVIDKNVSIKNLIGTLDFFIKNYFGPSRKTRLRPYNFRFTEPSFEVDINCPNCLGKGCKTCKGGWHELGGAGMVHPNVLKKCGVDTKKYNGFAFGWGVERIAMMKYHLPDLRMIYQNDLRFLKQM